MRRREHATRRGRSSLAAVRAALLAGLVLACAPEPVPIVYGEDVCTHCRMAIVDERYGAELVLRTGRTLPFDAIECLAAYLVAMDDTARVHSLWVTPFDAPGTLIATTDALFLQSPTLRSPMGANLTAFRAAELSPAAAVDAFGGTVLDWPAVLELARTRAPMHGHAAPSVTVPTAADTQPRARR